MLFRVNEIFAGLEGEGANVGTPCVRVRLQGCTQKCKLRKVCDQASALPVIDANLMTAQQIVEAVRGLDPAGAPFRVVAISGGEPTEQPVEDLAFALVMDKRYVQLETSGLARLIPQGYIDHFCHIRVSPKEPAPKATLQNWGHELSVVWTGAEDLAAWEQWGDFKTRTLQPLWRPDGSSNVQECIAICLERPQWRLSVQQHKLLGLP